jgi:hypothetical protein
MTEWANFQLMKRNHSMQKILVIILLAGSPGCEFVKTMLPSPGFQDGDFIVHQYVETKNRFLRKGCDIDYTKERKMSCGVGGDKRGEFQFVACAGSGYSFWALMSPSADGTWEGPGPVIVTDDGVYCVTKIELLGPLKSPTISPP